MNVLLKIILVIIILSLFVSVITIVIISINSKNQYKDLITKGGGYTINKPIISSFEDSQQNSSSKDQDSENHKITLEESQVLKVYFESIYKDVLNLNNPILIGLFNNITLNLVNSLVFGVVFWEISKDKEFLLDFLKKYFGEVYSFEKMVQKSFEPPKLNQLYSPPEISQQSWSSKDLDPKILLRNIYDTFGWWNVPYYNGYPNYCYLECIQKCNEKKENTPFGSWTYVAPGSGLYFNIKKSLSSHNKIHAIYKLFVEEDEKEGLFNFLSFILKSCCAGKGWTKDKDGFYTGIFQDTLDNDCPPWFQSKESEEKDLFSPTKGKYDFQVDTKTNYYIDYWGSRIFGGPIPDNVNLKKGGQPYYPGCATIPQREFISHLIGRVIKNEMHIFRTLKRLNVPWPIPEQNVFFGDQGLINSIVYLTLAAVFSPDPMTNVDKNFYFERKDETVNYKKYLQKNMEKNFSPSSFYPFDPPSDRQLWYWIYNISNTKNFDRFLYLKGKQLGFDSIQFTTQPNTFGCFGFELLLINQTEPKIFNPFTPIINKNC
jgi:hypothetical protein